MQQEPVGRHQQWVCKCAESATGPCGNCRRREHLKHHNKKLGALRRKPSEDVALHSLYLHVRCSAKERELAFELDESSVRAMFQRPCFYCGAPPELRRRKLSSCRANGLDRIDSSKGYVAGNVVPCCGKCNVAKGLMSQAEFFAWASRVVNFTATTLFVQIAQQLAEHLESASESPIALIAKQSLESAARFEDAFAGVRKQVFGS